MTIILFLIDTSSSMCQKAYVNGVQKTYLDIAKGAVETFLKYRQRTQDCMGDRYMLLTFEEPPANVKAGWKENHATFMNELKNLQSTGLTSMGESLKNAFDLLNLNRMQSGIDTYGQGRCPFYLEPSVIIVISDGGRYSYRNGVHPEIILPLNTQIPGTKFTKEPFRWDQRLFSLVLRMSGNKTEERVEGKVPHDDSPIERMCEVTGGRSYRVRSHHVLNQCIESLVQKVQPGVVLQFEPMFPRDINQIPNEALQDIVFPPTKKMIYVPKHITQKTFPIGYWPLPEPYWPDPKAVTLPPRDAHPKLKIVTPAVDEPQMVRNFPVDKYEIEASPLTLQILQKREMNKCWQVIISNGMHGFELPFGYLKAAPNFSQVHLYVLAYNYPALLPLLHDLIHKYNMSPPSDLMYKFNAYVRSIPPYYCPFLRKALLNINVPYPVLQFLLPENVDNYLSPNIANQLKHIKNTAKQEQENLCMKVYKQLKQPKPPYRQIETAKLNPGVPLRRDLVRHPLLRDTFLKMHSDIEPLENFTIVVPQLTRQTSAKSYRNPFDIPRRDIVEEISRMRDMFLRPTSTSLIAKDSGHCLPIAEMGNYQEYLKNKDIPLRELEPTNVRQHMFGNPYKKDKHISMVDEADLSDVAPMTAANGGGGGGGIPGGPPMPIGGMVGMSKKFEGSSRARKRKAGPIRKDFVFRRLSTSVSSSPSSSPSSGSMSPANSLSDYEDDSSNESSSISSGISSEDSDTERSMESFDFNEENTEQDFPLNGYVHSFINGDESCENVEMNSLTSNSVPHVLSTTPNLNNGVLVAPNSINLLNPIIIPNGLAPHLQVSTPTTAPHTYISNNYVQPIVLGDSGNVLVNPLINATAPTILQPANTYGTPQVNGNSVYPSNLNNVAVPAAVVLQVPATANINAHAPPNVIATSVAVVVNSNTTNTTANAAHTLHSDINDAQEISRILQQCHNGNSNSASANVSANFDMVVNDSKGDFETSNITMPPQQSNATGSHLTNSANAAAAAALSNCFDNLKREGSSNVNHNHQHPQQNSSNSNHATGNHQTNHKRRNNTAAATAAAAATAVFPPLTEEQRDAARRHNLDLRAQVFREIRRPGRNYTQLLEHLSLMKGDMDMKSTFVQMCIAESLRFRRKQMVSSIEAWWEKKKNQLQQPLASS